MSETGQKLRDAADRFQNGHKDLSRLLGEFEFFTLGELGEEGLAVISEPFAMLHEIHADSSENGYVLTADQSALVNQWIEKLIGAFK